VGALMRVVVLGFFTITLVVYAIDHGVHGFPVSDLSPTMGRLPRPGPARAVQLRRLRAAERRGGGDGRPAARRAPLRHPERHHRRLLYAVPVFGIIVVLPPEAITGIGGFIDAVNTTFGVYGGAKGLPARA
jgi:hypothetical protein